MNDGNKTTDNCKCCDLTTQSAVKSLLKQVCSSFWNKFGKSKYNNFLETELSCIQKTCSFRIVYSQGVAHLFSAISCAVASLQLIDHLTVLLPAHLILLLHHLLFLLLKYNEIYTVQESCQNTKNTIPQKALSTPFTWSSNSTCVRFR